MCTVTLIPKKDNNFILTSNRDEAIDRKTITPDFYNEDGVRMLYPKDVVAGGTWIGVGEFNSLICLLNGGFQKHESVTGYRKSRGVVVKDLLKFPFLQEGLESYDYTNIEPFTIVGVQWQSDLKLYELVWDGLKAHIKKLNRSHKYIWSSSTLYTPEMKSIRQIWFDTFKKNNVLTSESLYQFHKTAGIGDKNIDLVMNREYVATTSITQVEKKRKDVTMEFTEVVKSAYKKISFEPTTV